MYDLIIVGGGPAGVSAGIYAARKKMTTLLITDGFGGQSVVSADIQNWVGTPSISGFDLAKTLEEHLRAQKGIDIIDDDRVVAAQKRDDGTFSLATKNGKTYEAKNLILVSGSSRKKLGVPGEAAFEGKGVVYCSICDAPLFGNKTVAVVGGGNSALESVLDLIPYASKIYLVVRSEVLKGDQVTQEKVKAHPKVEIVWNAVAQEVVGKDSVTGFRYQNAKTNEVKELAVDGVFVEIGLVPNSDFVKDLVDRDAYGAVKVDARTQMTSCPGIWAAGDVTDALYKQNNTSAGDAIKAALNVYDHLKKQ
ncbi:MAG: FAD-dependent oxidoreductase [Minisyncoccia bacterium]|jgi:thioredoxin-disulfide reductase